MGKVSGRSTIVERIYDPLKIEKVHALLSQELDDNQNNNNGGKQVDESSGVHDASNDGCPEEDKRPVHAQDQNDHIKQGDLLLR